MSERILIVEDEAAIQAVLYELLTSQGYEVVVSGDGLDGLTKFREQYSRCARQFAGNPPRRSSC